MPLSKALNILDWLLRIVVAVILLQTLFFKFTGAKESVYIFTTLGAEPWGRIGSGVVELIASILILGSAHRCLWCNPCAWHNLRRALRSSHKTGNQATCCQ